jgi:hypothetical protein
MRAAGWSQRLRTLYGLPYFVSAVLPSPFPACLHVRLSLCLFVHVSPCPLFSLSPCLLSVTRAFRLSILPPPGLTVPISPLRRSCQRLCSHGNRGRSCCLTLERMFYIMIAGEYYVRSGPPPLFTAPPGQPSRASALEPRPFVASSFVLASVPPCIHLAPTRSRSSLF